MPSVTASSRCVRLGLRASDQFSPVQLTAMHFKSRRLPFGSQSRERRKAAFISVKNEIRRHAGVLGGLFSTDDYLPGKNGWIDCFFLGSKPPVFYNCVIDTTRNLANDTLCSFSNRRFCFKYRIHQIDCRPD